MMNKLSSYKLQIYNSFVARMGPEASVDLQLYHCDPRIFLSIMTEKKGAFDYYVIMPHFKDEAGLHRSMTKEVFDMLKDFPEDSLVLLDNYIPELRQASSIYQDFKMDIYEALQEGVDLLRKYQKMILVFPKKAMYPFPLRIQQGFQKFCTDHEFPFEVLDEIDNEMELESRDAYIIIEEQDLVSLVKQARDRKFELGKDLGVISYNDTPLKDLLGITVITTDFDAMGETAAYMIQSRKHEVVKNSFRFIDRGSL
jgi:DNA-binding LacI/PurR family transcriptional regulator